MGVKIGSFPLSIMSCHASQCGGKRIYFMIEKKFSGVDIYMLKRSDVNTYEECSRIAFLMESCDK